MVSAGEAAGASITLPWGLAVMFALAATLAPFLAAWLSYRAASKQVAATVQAALAQQRANSDREHRELIYKGMDRLAEHQDPFKRVQGEGILEAAEVMELSKDNRLLLASQTLEKIQSALERAQRDQEATGEPPKAWTRVLPSDEEEAG